MPVGLEASAKIGDTGVNASPEGVEVVIVSAVQYLLFDKPPQAFDQIKVGRIGRQVKEFDAWCFGLAGKQLLVVKHLLRLALFFVIRRLTGNQAATPAFHADLLQKRLAGGMFQADARLFKNNFYSLVDRMRGLLFKQFLQACAWRC